MTNGPGSASRRRAGGAVRAASPAARRHRASRVLPAAGGHHHVSRGYGMRVGGRAFVAGISQPRIRLSSIVSAQQPATQQPATQRKSAAAQPAADAASADAVAAGTAQPSPIKIALRGILYSTCSTTAAAPATGDVPLWSTPGSGQLEREWTSVAVWVPRDGPHGRQGETERRPRSGFLRRISSIGIGDNMGVLRLRQAHARARLAEDVDCRWTGLDDLRAGQSRVARLGGHSVDGRVRLIRGHAAAGARRLACGADAAAGRRAGAEHGRLLGGVLPSPTSRRAVAEAVRLQAARRGRRRTGWIEAAGVDRLSGHYGRSRVRTAAFDRELDSRGVAIDWSVAFAPRVTLTGEAFTGRNLAAFQAGVFRGINPDAASVAATGSIDDGPRAIGTRGGWTQVAVAVHPGDEQATVRPRRSARRAAREHQPPRLAPPQSGVLHRLRSQAVAAVLVEPRRTPHRYQPPRDRQAHRRIT